MLPHSSPGPGPLDLIATSTFGLEAVVARELQHLGYEPKILQSGRILFPADAAAVCRANLWLRAADRVLLRLGSFEATDFGQLFDRTYALPWEQWIPPDGAFPVSGRSIKSQLSSVPACQKIVKKAVVEKLKAAYGTEWFAESGPKFAIEVALLDDRATLTIDTTGPGLHKRGYRALVGKAPLKETLAAALVLLSYWKPQRPLVDPFCGTGTIPIEAALVGCNMAPGAGRAFAAESWPALPASLWEDARRQAREVARPDMALRISGTDLDEEALRLARHHAEKAGVAEHIHFQERSFAELTSKRPYGCVICNPPYGQRMGRQPELQTLYRDMPEVFRRLKTWSFYILTAQPDFETLLGQQANRRRKLYNGRIQCTYYQYYGPKPGRRIAEQVADADLSASDLPASPRCNRPSEDNLVSCSNAPSPPAPLPPAGEGSSCPTAPLPPAGEGSSCPTAPLPPAGEGSSCPTAPLPPAGEGSCCSTAAKSGDFEARKVRNAARPAFGGLSQKAFEQAEIFRSRLGKRARHLRRWPTKLGITCYRLYDRDIPEVPLVVDRYEDCLHLAEYERPHDHTPAEHGDWLDLMKRVAGEVLEIPPANIFLKRRQRQRGPSQYERVAEEGRTKIVSEGGLRFEVNLSDYLDTGLFLDHRITRGMVRQAAAGKRVVNLFAYTGSFTVYAAAGGAASTVTVDLSQTHLDWARRNMALNNLTGPAHELLRDDALSFLESCPRRPLFDLAVVDPPTFSNSKRLEEFWDIQRDHAELLRRLLELMAPGGVIFFSTNFRRFKLAEEKLTDVAVREISRQTVPPDFRNRRIHRCWRMTTAIPPGGSRRFQT